jgi:hypothetical protein
MEGEILEKTNGKNKNKMEIDDLACLVRWIGCMLR